MCINTRKEKLKKLVIKYLTCGNEVEYEKIGDFIEGDEDEYVDLYMRCVEQYDYQDFLMLSVFKIGEKKNQMFALSEDEENTQEFYEYVENNNTPFAWVGSFVYRFRIADEGEYEKYEYDLEFSQYM